MSSNGTGDAGATSSSTRRSASQTRSDAPTKSAAAAASAATSAKSPISNLFNSIRGGSASILNGSSASSKSPVSPSRITRQQEKEEMQNLNDRLVIYIDTVRRLESENSRLQGIVHSYSENSTRDVSEIKQLYERELEDAKRLIDELAKEKAKFEIEVNKHKANAQESQHKYERRDKECKQLESRLKSLEAEYAEYKTRCELAQNDLTRFQNELAHLRPHSVDLENQLANLKKQLEEETLLRVDLENKNTTLKEDLHFKSQIYDKETDQLRSSKRIEIEQVDVRLRDEYDSKLVSELQRIREETEYKIKEMKDEVERRYQNKFAESESQSKRSQQQTNVLREEVASYRSKLDETLSDISNLQKKLSNYEAKIKELEERLKKANAKYDNDIADKDAEIDNVRKEMAALLIDYQDLYDIKIALDLEIGAYRKLLESEEQRLNISTTMGTSNLQNSYLNDSISTSTTTRGNNKKRRLAQASDDDLPAVAALSGVEPIATVTQSSDSKCGIVIADHDYEGNLVTLINSTDKDMPIGNWSIKRNTNVGESEYKFSKNFVLKANSQVNVWSHSCASAKNEPPNDLTSKQAWSVSDSMITVLNDKEGNVS